MAKVLQSMTIPQRTWVMGFLLVYRLPPFLGGNHSKGATVKPQEVCTGGAELIGRKQLWLFGQVSESVLIAWRTARSR